MGRKEMGLKLDALMGKGFRSSKCKTLLKLTVARVKILSNKKELQCKQLRKDIAQLLKNKQEASALIRVEHLFREQNMLDAYLLIGGYCEAVSERIKFIKMQKTCPDDMKESIASLVFAAPRCADLPELQDVRSLFTAKYGKEFTESAVELHAGCGVNKQMMEKLSTKVPNSEVKIRLLKEVASEHGIKWNFEEVDAKELKPTKVQDGSQNFETTQATLKPQDVTHESDKIPFGQQASGSKDKQDTQSSTKQRPEGLACSDINISNSSPDPLNIKMDSVACPILTTDIDLNISENDLYARQGKDSGMDFHRTAKNTDANHDFVMFAKHDAVAAGMKQENVDLKQENGKYRDVAAAAQAAFESAAYAAIAARAAVELSKRQSWNKMPNESVNDPREKISESEDELGEPIQRNRTDGKFAESPGGGRSIEGTFSTKNDQAFDIISPRKRNGANDVFHTMPGFMETQYSGKELSDSESGEEPSEEQDFWSKNTFHVHKSSQKHLSNYSDGEKEFETDSPHKDGKLDSEQMLKGMNESQLKRSTCASTSSSNKTSSSPKSSHPLFDDYSGSHPLFDDYSDGEGDYEKNPTVSYSDHSILTENNSGTEDTHHGNTQYTNNQRQLHPYDENDEYEESITRKESKNQGSTLKTSGPSKLSYGDLLQKEYSLNHLELHSENEMEMMNDENVKFQGQRKSSMLNLHAPGNYESPTGIPVKNSIGIVSTDQSAYPRYKGNHKYQPHHGNKNQYFNKQDSDDEGVYRYEGDGKLSWQPANMDEKHFSVASRKSHHVNTRLSVRTRRL